MINPELFSIFKSTYQRFFAEETQNILNGVSERNLCARLGYLLQNELADSPYCDYFVDPEYNRKQNGELKTILEDGIEVVTINCDLIAHTRGELIEHDNLIALEMKKSTATLDEKEKDRKRLKALTKDTYDDVWSLDGLNHPEHVCGYKLGVYMELNLNRRRCLFEYYNKGKRALVEEVHF